MQRTISGRQLFDRYYSREMSPLPFVLCLCILAFDAPKSDAGKTLVVIDKTGQPKCKPGKKMAHVGEIPTRTNAFKDIQTCCIKDCVAGFNVLLNDTLPAIVSNSPFCEYMKGKKKIIVSRTKCQNNNQCGCSKGAGSTTKCKGKKCVKM